VPITRQKSPVFSIVSLPTDSVIVDHAVCTIALILFIHVGFLEYLSFKQFKLIVKMTRIESGVTIIYTLLELEVGCLTTLVIHKILNQ
jgi:hypothetical protein